MPPRVWLPFALSLVTLLALVPAARAAHASNPWLERRIMHMTHQGGEFEAPSNTLYAFKRAVALGADMLELDVHPTADGVLVVHHDATVDRTTDGSGGVREKRLAEVRALDAAHNFIPGRNAVRGEPEHRYPLRGVRTGHKPPPAGYGPHDFRIPTLAEVFAAFPDIPINIEIKGRSDTDNASFARGAELLAEFVNRRRRRDLVVVSFNQAAVDRFHQLAPHIGVAPGVAGVAAFMAGGSPGEGVVALQVPTFFRGVPVATEDFVRRAHERGYAVHVFFDNQREEENADTFRRLVDICADGIMTAFPTRLEAVLQGDRLRRPDHAGLDPCQPGSAPAGPSCDVRPERLGRVRRGRRVDATVRRIGPAGRTCRLTLALRTAHARRAPGDDRRRVRTLARRRLELPAARRRVAVRLGLTRAGRALARRGPVATVVRVAARKGDTRRATLRLAAR